MNGAIRRLASPEALGANSLSIVFVIYLTGSSIILAFTASGNESIGLAVSAALSAVMFALLFPCFALLRGISDTTWRAGAVLAIVVLANALRALTFTSITERIGIIDPLPAPVRFGGASLLTLAGLLVVGELIDRRRRFQSAIVDLSARLQELSIARATYNERRQHATFELEANIHSVLDPALSLAALEFDRDTPERSSVTSAQLLQEILRVSVRPTIETLNTPMGLSSPATENPRNSMSTNPTQAIGRQGHRPDIDIVDSIRPALSVVPLRIIGIPMFFAVLGFVQGTLAILFFSLAWPLLILIRRLWPARFRTLPLLPAIASLTACFTVAFGIPMLASIVWQPQVSDLVDRASLGRFVTVNLVFSIATAWFVSTVSILERARRLTQEHLTTANEQIELSIARMRQEIWFTQQNLAWVLHGPVQSALVSATIRLESGVHLDEADRAAIWTSLQRAYEQLTTAGPAVTDFNSFATELTTLWQGVCTISFNDSNGVMERVAADPAATYAIIEVVREAVGNAIRHGNATTIEIGIHDQASDLVGLVITDNGSGLTDGAAPGVGSLMFDSLAYEWSRNTSPAGTTITAELTWSPAP